jgi:hypothetical protein
MIPKLARDFNTPDYVETPDAGLDIHLTSGNRSAVPRSLRPPGYSSRAVVDQQATPIFNPGLYGDAQVLTLIYAAAGDVLAIPRPATNQRVLLIIVNQLAAGNIMINYDNPGSAASGIPIAAGGNIFYDTVVPQNDVHIWASAAGTVQVSYMNLDITNVNRIQRGSQ